MDWYCSIRLYVQGAVQMFKVWFECSRFDSNVQDFVQNVLVLEVKEVDRAKDSREMLKSCT